MASTPVRSGRGKQPLTPLLFCLSTSVKAWKMGTIFSTWQYLSRKKRMKATLYKPPCTCLRVAASGPSLQEGAGLLVSADEGTAPLTVFADVAAAGDRRDRLSCTCLAGESSWVALGAHLASQSISHLRTLRTWTDTNMPQSTCWLSQSVSTIALDSLRHLAPDSLPV